jgi:oligopeptide transport system substrate-binding protein
MRKIKWIFIAYVSFVMLAIAGIAIAFNAAPPRDPDTYYSSYGAAVKTLDPAENNDTMGSQILGYVFEGLYNYKYGVYPYALFPELASAMPAVSADGLTMTIPVRHGIHYYDPEKAIWPDGVGPEITAADFVYSFKRVCDFNLPNPNYSFVYQDHFAGLEDWWKYTKAHPKSVDYDRPVEGFTAPDRYTLQLKFTQPYPQMVYNLVNNPCAPVCRAIAEHYGDKIRLHPVGSGPYALKRNLRDQQILLTANPIYRGRPDVDGGAVVAEADRLPKMKRVQLDYFEEELPVWIMLMQGLFDVGSIPKDTYSSAVQGGGDLTPEMVKKGIVLNKYSDPSTSYIGFNCSDPVLGKNKALRQAISTGFDRKAYIDKFLNGRGISAIGIIPPGFPTYDENRVNPYTVYNLDRAKQLMQEAVKINGGPIPKLSMLFRGTDTTERQNGEFYTEQFEKLGIELDCEYVDFARYQEKVDSRQTQLFDAGWSSDYPDEQDFLQLLYGKNSGPGQLNATVWINPEFDKLYDQSAVMSDTPERRQIYLKMEKIVEEDCPWVILFYPKIYSLQYDWVHDRNPMDYGHGFTEYYTIDKALRAKRLGGGH